ncbi:MAG: lipopolysaccharide biosynthesis regulator YciM [Vicingaceae bacterium]|jgi:lipopolysaccharide biosynthesis regulator YciM
MKKLSKLQVYGIFVIFGFLLYGNTLTHDFALDDAIVITENDFTKKGLSGIWDQLTNDQFVGFYGEKKELVAGGRYRPLSMVVYNVQYALAGENPFLGHLINVLFYILNGILLYKVLDRILPQFQGFLKGVQLPLLVSLLWFFHPIHTEVVANIKGLDEIMAFCLQLSTLWFVLNYIERNKIKDLLGIILSFFLGLLAKESTITWLAVIPLAIYFFTDYSFKKVLRAYGGLLGAAVIWAGIRYQVVGGGISSVADNIMNDPFLEATTSEKYATIMLTLGKYLQLLIFPHPLTYDYYPKHIPIVGWGNKMVLLSILAYLLLAVVAVWGFFKKNIVSFGIFLFIITLSIASNIVFVIGAFMNERFVYVSSLGFSLILGFGVFKLLESKSISKNVVWPALIVIFGLYSLKTISRNQVWENNLTLATHDANISVNGAKSNVMAGGIITENAMKISDPSEKQKMLQEGMVYLQRAINAYPEYIDALILMGNAQWESTKNINQALPYYYQILAINPYHQNTLQNFYIIVEQSKNSDDKINAYQTLLRYNPNEVTAYLNLGRTYGREKNDLKNAQLYLETALKIAANNYEVLSNLGTLYGLSKNYSAAIDVLKKAAQLKPNIAKTQIDLGLSYYYLGQLDLAKSSFDKAVQLDNSINRSQFPI